MSRARPLRHWLFTLHWLLGISAGLVLAVVGVTGALLSYEQAALSALNPGVMTVTPKGQPLAIADLLERARAQRPGVEIQALSLSSDPRESARISFAPASPGAGRGEQRFIDPYRGQLLPTPRGEGFFLTVEGLHRQLLVGEFGKQTVAIATVSLIFFCLSGLYLRWPRKRWREWRVWLSFDGRRQGRAFWWQLHTVAGTWLLLLYLLSASTGLWWSYPWYREALLGMAGMPAPTRPQPATGPTPAFDMAGAQAAFARAVPAWRTLNLRLPGADGRLQWRYLALDAAHERAFSTLELDARSLRVLSHERFEQRPFAQQLLASMFALHRGSYFGALGTALVMLASLAMPLFAFSGYWLYLDRRRRERTRTRAPALDLQADGSRG